MHARNLYERVTALLPRIDQFWYRYAHLEELMGNYIGARVVFEKWMKIEPEISAWMLYIKFEERCSEISLAQIIFERLLSLHPTVNTFLKFIQFEERHGNIERARAGFNKAVELLSPRGVGEDFFIKMTDFEERHGDLKRTADIFKAALEEIKDPSENSRLNAAWITFNKKNSIRTIDIEKAVLDKRRSQYIHELEDDQLNVDNWISLLQMEIDVVNALFSSRALSLPVFLNPSNGTLTEEEQEAIQRMRDVYDRAILKANPVNMMSTASKDRSKKNICTDKSFWLRFIHLFIIRAHFEEMSIGDFSCAREIWSQSVNIVFESSGGQVSFSKLYLLWAEFEIRRMDINSARKVLGLAIAKCGKPKIFSFYGNLELRLGNVDRVRNIYSKFIETHPFDPKAWLCLVELEEATDEFDRARGVFETALTSNMLTGVVQEIEALWERYIEFEIKLGEFHRARALFQRLLVTEKRTNSTSVWKLWVKMEIQALLTFIDQKKENSQKEQIKNIRKVIFMADETQKNLGLDIERAFVRSLWIETEEKIGDATQDKDGLSLARTCLPQRVVKVRRIKDDEFVRLGTDGVEKHEDGTIVCKEELWSFAPLPLSPDGEFGVGVTGGQEMDLEMDEDAKKKADMILKAKEWKFRKEAQSKKTLLEASSI